MSAQPKIVILDRLQTGESANPSPDNILAGIPRARASNQYSEPTQQFYCGLWTSTMGKWRVRYTEHEFCVLIEGRVRIESASGEKHEMRAGDAFVVPAGFDGTWEVVEAPLAPTLSTRALSSTGNTMAKTTYHATRHALSPRVSSNSLG